MAKLKAQPQPEAIEKPAPSLADQIKEARAAAEAFIESKVQALKASPEGQALPITWLRLNLRATTRGGGCDCKVAAALLEKESK